MINDISQSLKLVLVCWKTLVKGHCNVYFTKKDALWQMNDTHIMTTWINLKYVLFENTTLPETNITPENRPSQKESNLPTIHFQGLESFTKNAAFRPPGL